MDKIKKWEIWGAAISILVGSFLHFVFELSGNNHVVALFGTVNESTWEHLKIAFWPTFIFAIIEWQIFGKQITNFCFATFIKIISIPVVIITLFYGWVLFFEDSLIYDIIIFIIAIILGYYFSYLIIKSKKQYGPESIWAILIFIILVKFSLFSYFPPKTFITKDPVSGGYGINK